MPACEATFVACHSVILSAKIETLYSAQNHPYDDDIHFYRNELLRGLLIRGHDRDLGDMVPRFFTPAGNL